MTKYLISIFLFGVFSSVCAQSISYPIQNDSSIVQIKDFYKGLGKIFRGEDEANRDYFGNKNPHPILNDYKDDLKLTEQQIIQVESLIDQNHSNLHIQQSKKQLCHYYRLYFGFTNESNEIIVRVQLLNFKNKRKAEHYFDRWDKYFSIGFGDFYSKNQITLLVNLSKGTVIRN